MGSQAGTQRTKRKEGGQPGNFNALKHGFYSRRFRDQESTDLTGVPNEQGLKDEIKLLKVIIRRVFEMAEAESEDNLENWIKVLAVCAAAMTRQSTLLRTQTFLGGSSDEVAQAISQAIAEVSDEISHKEPA